LENRSYLQAAIRITNNLAISALAVTPVLYMADGTPYTLKPVTVPQQSVVTVDINEALASPPPEIASHVSKHGSAVLNYVWRWQAAVSGSILSLDLPRSLTFTTRFIAPPAGSTAPGKQNIEGLWWSPYPESDGFLSMYNNSSAALEASLQLYNHKGQSIETRQELIQPRSTKLLHLTDLALATRPRQRLGGLRVSYVGEPRALVVNGGIEDSVRGYSAALPLMTAGMSMRSMDAAHSSFASAGMMIGKQDPMMGFPEGIRFEPFAFLRNVSGHPLLVTPTVNFSQDGQPITIDLELVTLEPNESTELQVSRLLKKAGLHDIHGSINVAFDIDAVPGSLLVSTGSVDESGNYVFEVEPQALQTTTTKQIPFWSTADGNDTMINLWNPSYTEQSAVLTFFYPEGQYRYPIYLAPKASTMVSVKELQMMGTAETGANRFPQTAKTGSAWLSSAAGTDEDLNVIASVGTFNALTATCGTTRPIVLGSQMSGSPQTRSVGPTSTTFRSKLTIRIRLVASNKLRRRLRGAAVTRP
jgi:hypothetical protein